MAHRRSPARWLAPLALVVCAVAVYATVTASTGSSSPDTATTAPQRTRGTTTISTSTAPTNPAKPASTYTVRSGDILSTISDRTGVSVEDLHTLNPGIDARVLRVGQKLRLRP
jgi:LysM repeat protein